MRSEADAVAARSAPGAALGRTLFRLRGYTPIPLVLVFLVGARPSLRSALLGGAWIALGETLRLWGVAHAGSVTRTREVGAPRLVTSGPFAYTRNPLYTGNLCMTAGFAVMANAWMPWSLVCLLAAFAVQYTFIVRLEEARLGALFGDAYVAYRDAVPRFGARWSPYPAPPSEPGDWRAAWVSEKRTFQTTALLLVALAARAAWSAR